MATKTSDLVFRLIGKDETGTATKSAAANLDHVGDRATSLGKTLAGVGAAVGVAVLASKVKDFAADSIKSFETVGAESVKLQRIMGGSVDQMSALRGAAQLTGVSTDSMATAMRKFSTDIEGNNKAFAQLGIATRDAAGNLRPTNDVLMDVAATFKDMPNGAEKSALAVQLFGRSGLDMLPMLNRGADGIAALEQKTRDYGLTLSKVDQDNLAKFRASQRDLSMATEGVKTSFGKSLFPVMTEFNAALAQVLPPLQQALTPALQAMGDVAVLAIRKLAENMPAVQRAVQGLAGDIKQGAGWIEQNWGAITDTVERLAGAAQRVGGFMEAMWTAFRDLPPEAQELIALLAVAQKTGVLSVAFKAADIVKSLFTAGMNVDAAVVNVAGAGVGAAAGESMGKGFLAKAGAPGAWIAAAAPWVAAAASVLAAGAALDYSLNKHTSALVRQSPGAMGGTYAAMGSGGVQLSQGQNEVALQRQQDWPAWMKGLFGVRDATVQASQAMDGLSVAGKNALDQTTGAAARAKEHMAALAESGNLTTTNMATLQSAVMSMGLQAGVSTTQLGAINQVIAAMPTGTNAQVLAEAIRQVGAAAGLTDPQIQALTAAATGVPSGDNVAALGLRIQSVGAASGISQDFLAQLAGAVNAMPPGTNVDQLRALITTMGQAAGLSQGQIDVLTGAINAVPASANLPALTFAIAAAGNQSGMTQGQIDAMSAAVAAVPPGATAQQMGEAIRVAGEKAGLTSEQVDRVTSAVNAVPTEHHTNITSNADEAWTHVASLQKAIDDLHGGSVSVQVGLGVAGATTSDARNSYYGTGSAPSGVQDWLTGNVQAFAEALAPKLAPALGIALPGTGNSALVADIMESWIGLTEVNGHTVNNMCLGNATDAVAAAGYPVNRRATAWEAGQAAAAAGMLHRGYAAPRGALYFWSSLDASGAGHVAVADGRGNAVNSWGPAISSQPVSGMAPYAFQGWAPPEALALARGGMVRSLVSDGEYVFDRAKASRIGVHNLDAINGLAWGPQLSNGLVRGPGTGTSDSVPGWLPTGGYVVRAAAVRAVGPARLDALARGYSLGGLVEQSRSQSTAILQSVIGGPPVVAPVPVAGGGTQVVVQIDGRVLHESLVRYRRAQGGAPLGLG